MSVVVPSCNEAGTIDSCLGALARQDHPHDRYEVLLIDGDSKDGTREAAAAYGVRILQDGHSGPSGARNVGVREAHGRIVAFTDADCIPADDWVRRIVEVFDERPELGGVGGALRMPRIGWRGRLEDMHALAHYRGFITSNVAYRRDVLLKVGGFDESLKCAEDWDLACRVRDAGFELLHDPRPLVVHAPPELRSPPLVFLRKDAWYGRHDVPAHMIALRRALQGQAAPESREHTLRAVREAVLNSAWFAAFAGGALTLNPLLAGVGVGGALLGAGTEVVQAARKVRAQPASVPPMVALHAVRKLFRGAGTLAGLTEFGVAQTRGRLARRSALRAPSLPPAGRPPPTAP